MAIFPLISSMIQEVFKYLKEKLMKHICDLLKIYKKPVYKISSIFSSITTFFINRDMFYRLLWN